MQELARKGFPVRGLVFNPELVFRGLIIDKDNGGEISVEEAIEDLYLQHGKEELDNRLEDMFGADLDVNDPEAVLDLEKFVSAMRLGQLKQMREKTMNKTKSSSSLKKKSSSFR